MSARVEPNLWRIDAVTALKHRGSPSCPCSWTTRATRDLGNRGGGDRAAWGMDLQCVSVDDDGDKGPRELCWGMPQGTGTWLLIYTVHFSSPTTVCGWAEVLLNWPCLLSLQTLWAAGRSGRTV